jgi:endonuclease/exonuclease/phosphatase family metal-dependent hydrolase
LSTENEKPSQEIELELLKLRAKLDKDIPSKVLDQNLLVATWNIRAFGGLTEKWESTDNDSPKRDLQSLHSIAEIISRFDVIALQEVRADIKALRHLLKILGSHWGVILTDETKGRRGNGERLAFVFDTRKVKLSGLACEIVIPPEDLGISTQDNDDESNSTDGDAPKTEKEDKDLSTMIKEQFARTPYAVGFLSGGRTFILVTLHVIYGKDKSFRKNELQAISEWMGEWALDVHAWDHNLIALGDFNIDREGDELYDALFSSGLRIPSELRNVPRTIFDSRDTPNPDKFYDQIAWFIGAQDKPALTLQYKNGGYFDFTDCVLQKRMNSWPAEDRNELLSWHISDHFPLWVLFDVREIPEKGVVDEESEKRRTIAKIPTEMENAISTFIFEMEHNGTEVPDLAEKHLVDLLFNSSTIDGCEERIRRVKKVDRILKIISLSGIELAKFVSPILASERADVVGIKHIDKAIQEHSSKVWPFDVGLKNLGSN